MPKGKHKGKHRVFTSPEQLEEEAKREERAREWRQRRGEASSDDDSESGSGSDSGSGSSDGEEAKAAKPKGPQVAVQNPNRVVQKNKKLSSLTVEGDAKESAPLSRREREAVEKERARQHYQKLHAQGKTAEAQADLARLAIIRKQRQEAAKKRDEEKKAKEASTAKGKR